MKVIVVGAGVAGLGAATYFAKKGHDVRVLEAADRVGGRALTLRRTRGADRVDVGTQYYHSSYARAQALMREVGVGGLTKITGSSRFFDDRARGGSFLVDHRLPWIKAAGLAGNARVGWTLASLLRHRMSTFALEEQPKLDAVRALDVLTHPTQLEFAVRSLTLAGAITEPEPTDVSLLHVIRLVRIIVLTDYLTLPAGIASFHEALAARLAIELETPVRGLVEEGTRVIGVELDGTGKVQRADHVVVATTAPAALRFVPTEWTEEREFLAKIVHPPFAFPTFFLDRPLQKGVWSYVSQYGKGKKVSLILDAAQKSPAMVPSGKSVLQPWPCFPASRDLVGLSDDAIVEACRRELEDYFPGFSSWVEEVHVTRHPYAVPFHPAGHQTRALDFLRRVDARSGVSFCGDYLSGGYVEPALWSAERAATKHA